MKITAEQKESFIKIIADIIEQAREQKGMIGPAYKYSTEDITREALENFEDLSNEMIAKELQRYKRILEEGAL